MRAILDNDAEAVPIAGFDAYEDIGPDLPWLEGERLRTRLGDELARDDVTGRLDVEARANGGPLEADADDAAAMGRDGRLRRVSRAQPLRLRRHVALRSTSLLRARDHATIEPDNLVRDERCTRQRWPRRDKAISSRRSRAGGNPTGYDRKRVPAALRDDRPHRGLRLGSPLLPRNALGRLRRPEVGPTNARRSDSRGARVHQPRRRADRGRDPRRLVAELVRVVVPGA